MAAAYAALLSLINNMEQIMNHPRLSTLIHTKQIASLRDRVDSLLDFIEKYDSQGGNQTLESRIASASYEAEDVIESYIVDKIPAGSTRRCYKFLPDLQRVIEKMDSIMETVIKVKEATGLKNQQPTFSIPATSSGSPDTGKTKMVGFDEELIQLMDVLTGQQSSRQIISLAGMGGSGKSTLARNVYENSLIVQHFDVRAWVTISQQYSVREVLIDLLSSKQKSTSATVQELGLKLHKSLSCRRYLIILDDMWSIDVWNKIGIFFPDNSNGSRIVLTTRLANVATQCSSIYFKMNFLDEHKSWILLCETVFGGSEDCPRELKSVGKRISELCKGLPLSVVVIGGLLRRSNKTLEYWNYVAENINSVLSTGGDDDCSKILSLSYDQLAIHLKPCFLYMGIFREDREIRASRIIKYWVSEGFIKSNGAEMLEEIAEGYLNDLIDRNLILVGRHRYNAKIRSCRVHDLIRDLCLKVSEKEKFLFVGRARGVNRERRIVFHDFVSSSLNYELVDTLESELFRSLVCRGVKLPVVFRLLRVLNMANDSSIEALLKNLNLRFLSYQLLSYWRTLVLLPSSISLIWNLQTLAIHGRAVSLVVAPPEIWNLPQLRHVECNKIYLPDPPQNDGEDDFVVLLNLRTLTKAVNLRLSKEVCKRIPNVIKLHLIYDDTLKGYDVCFPDHLHYLGSFRKTQSLKLVTSLYRTPPSSARNWLNCKFPQWLHKLSLTNGRLDWKDLTVIGSLPQLKVLKLENSVVRQNWNPLCGEFLSLNSLTIENCDLRCWNADDSHFPVLKKLRLVGLLHLEEIPSGIGDIPTLELIRLDSCSESAVLSAMDIKEEQESLGNDGLQIEVVEKEYNSEKLSKKLSEKLSKKLRIAVIVILAAFHFSRLKTEIEMSIDYL